MWIRTIHFSQFRHRQSLCFETCLHQDFISLLEQFNPRHCIWFLVRNGNLLNHNKSIFWNVLRLTVYNELKCCTANRIINYKRIDLILLKVNIFNFYWILMSWEFHRMLEIIPSIPLRKINLFVVDILFLTIICSHPDVRFRRENKITRLPFWKLHDSFIRNKPRYPSTQ